MVAPPRLLEQLEAAESFDRQALVSTLARQPIAAVLVDQSFSEAPLPGVAMLVHGGAFPHDAEATLNRLLTERRAQLYRLGSDLSRGLTTGGIWAGLDALLALAEQTGGRQLVALDAHGALIATSRASDESAPVASAALQPLFAAPPTPRLLRGRGGDWLALRLRPVGAGGLQRNAALLIGPVEEGSRDIDRLVLTQTAQAVELLLGQAAGDRLGGQRQRGQREALVAELLRGGFSSREAAAARARRPRPRP